MKAETNTLHNPFEATRSPNRVASKVKRVAASIILLSSLAAVEKNTEQVELPGYQDTDEDYAPESEPTTEIVEDSVEAQEKLQFNDVLIFNSADAGINQYERDFQTEADDHAQTREQVAAFVSENQGPIRLALENGEKIHISGFASAEDDTPGGGFQEVDTPNAEGHSNASLAKEGRGVPAMDAFIAEVADQLDLEVSVDQIDLDGIEDEWSDNELAEATALAEKEGFTTVEDMTDAWNRDPDLKASMSDETAQFLTNTLDLRRGYEIVVPTIGAQSSEQASINESAEQIEVVENALPSPEESQITVEKNADSISVATIDKIEPPSEEVTDWKLQRGEQAQERGPQERESAAAEDRMVQEETFIPQIPTTNSVPARRFRQEPRRNTSKQNYNTIPTRIKQPHAGNFNNTSKRNGKAGKKTVNRKRGGNRAY